MKNFNLHEMTWPEVSEYLQNKKTIILPVGSTEQHGPNGMIGTDFVSAWEIAKSVGAQTKTIVASPVCYGMALHHMGFAGSASFKPSTYVLLMTELISSFAQTGFTRIEIINGHGGNIAPLTTAFSEAKLQYRDLGLALHNWWHTPEVQAYEKENFGALNGFHATIGEISVTMHTTPEAYQTHRNFEFFNTPEKYDWPLSASEFRKTFPDGRMGSDPRMATAAHGKKIFDIAVEAIAKKISC